MVCNVKCGCSKTFDRVDQFEKHIRDCHILQDRARGITGHEQEHLQILGLKKHLNSVAMQDLNQQLSLSSNETPNTIVRDLKRKRTVEREEGIYASTSLPFYHH